MTKYINRQRKRAEKVRFTELKRRQHMSVILETKQLCKFYGAGENQVKAVNQWTFRLSRENLSQLLESQVPVKVHYFICLEG